MRASRRWNSRDLRAPRGEGRELRRRPTMWRPPPEQDRLRSHDPHLRGLAFHDTADGEARGLSWSDFAVLFRSVAKDADPLVAEMRRRDIPYVVKGLNRLFDSPEITAVVGVFRYIAGVVEAHDLRALWQDANLLPASGDWANSRCRRS